jgi:hypothetical protein
MNQENFCKDCHQKHDCQEGCNRLNDSKCPHFVWKSIAAFLLPILIFIISLAVFEKAFSRNDFLHISQKLRVFFGFVAALLSTIICMLIVKLLCKLFRIFS